MLGFLIWALLFLALLILALLDPVLQFLAFPVRI